MLRKRDTAAKVSTRMPEPVATLPLVMPAPEVKTRVRRDVEYAPGVHADIFTPDDDAPHATIVFIHGGPLPDGARAKNMRVFRDYGALAAAAGFTAMTFSHRFYGTAIEQAAADVAAAIAFAEAQPEVDRERLFFWAFSGGGPLLTLAFDRPNVRAIVSYYAALDLITPELRARLSPLLHLQSGAHCPPMFIARAGKDHPQINASVEAFVAEALRRNVELELMTHVEGQHGFDILNDDDRSRAIIRRTFDFIREHAR
jgi:acetyl esterase/lipase